MSWRSSLADLRQVEPSEDERPLSDETPQYKGDEKKGEGRCGCGRCTPNCLQVCNSPRWLLFFMCILSAAETAIVLGLLPAVISTIERRFEFSSAKSGFLVSSIDMFAAITVPAISYYGGKTHKGRWVGAAAVFLGLGSSLFAIPHFLTGRYVASGTNMSESGGALCHPLSNRSANGQCNINGSDIHLNYLYVFVAAQLLISFCGGPLYTLGIAYLDENVKKKVSGLYIGVLYSMISVGPAVGYVISAQLLNQHIDWPEVANDSSGLTPADPRWLGNWWLGFFVLASVGFLVAIPLFCYPARLRDPENRQVLPKEEPSLPDEKDIKDDFMENKSDDNPSTVTFCGGSQDFREAVKDLGSNYSYVLLALAGCPESLVMAAFTTFGPKLGQTQLGLPASQSALYLGLLFLPAGAIGNLFGGWLSKKAGADCRKLLKILLVLSGVSILGHCVFLLYCNTTATASYLYSDGDSTSCAADCGCADSLYDPICDVTGIEYQSGCHAGCTGLNQTGHTVTYFNCSCIIEGWLFENVTSGSGSEAVHGPCPGGCPGYTMPLFLTVMFLLVTTAMATFPPFTAAIMRLVPESRRSFALGVQWTLNRLLGFIPGPIVFGYIIDQACVLWQESCGEGGACQVYDSGKLGLYMLAATIGIRLVSMALYLASYCLYKPTAAKKTRLPANGDMLETMI